MLGQDLRNQTSLEFQEQLIALVRAFGLHRPDQTPCGQPISVAEVHALMELANTVPLSQNELARRLRLEKSTISRLVGILEQRGWVERTQDPVDRRVVRLRLTQTGHQAADNLAAAREAKFTRLLQAIPETKRAPVIQTLKLLVEVLRES